MNLAGKSIRVAVIDDDLSIREGLIGLLNALGYQCLGFPSAPDFIGFDGVDMFSCLMIDVHMPDMSGLELLQWLQDRKAAPPAILMTSHASEGVKSEALRLGAREFLDKSRSFDTLKAAIERLTGG